MCEIPSRRFNTVFTDLLLGRGSLPPDFADRCVKSLALVLAHNFKAFCLVITSARLCQQMCEIPSRGFNTVLTGPLLGRGSLPPDFANRCVKSLAVVLTRCLQVFCSVAAHFRQILPTDV